MRIHRYAVLAVLASAASSIATAVVVTGVMPAGATDTTNFGVQQVSGVYFSVDPGTQESGIAECPKHELAVGGGYAIKGSVGIEGPSVTTSEGLPAPRLTSGTSTCSTPSWVRTSLLAPSSSASCRRGDKTLGR